MKILQYKTLVIIMIFCVIPMIYSGYFNAPSPALYVIHANAKTNQANEIHVLYWYTENDVEKPGVLKLVSDFNAMHYQVDGQTVVIDAVQKGFFNAEQDYKTAYVAGNEPNLFRSARDWVSEFGYSGLIQPLENFFNQTEINDFIPEGIRMSTYIDSTGQSHLFAIPQQLDAAALMFNKHILESAGINTSTLDFNTSWSWPQFLDNLNLIYNTTGIYGYTLAGMDFGAQALFFGNGGQLFYNDTVSMDTIAINSTQSRYAFQFIKSLVDSNVTPPYSLQGWNTINPDFSGGKVAMIQQGPWQLKDYLDNSPEFNPNVTGAKPYASADNLGFMEFPKDAEGHQGVPLGMQAYVISSRVSGDLLTATVAFLKYITSQSAEVYQAMNYYHVPARKSAYTNTTLTSSPSWYYIKGFKANIDTAATLPVHYAWSIIETNFANELDAYLAGKETLNVMISKTINWWAGSIQPETPTRASADFNTVFFLLGFIPLVVIELRNKRRKNLK